MATSPDLQKNDNASLRPQRKHTHSHARNWLSDCVWHTGSETWIPLPPNMGEDERGEKGRCRACDKYNFTRAQPCWSAASLVLQLWQARRSHALHKQPQRQP